MPRKKQITKCRAASGCGQKVLEGGCFCADHELLWIAKTGSTSERIRTKHAKMYQQFKRQQERAQEDRILASRNRQIEQWMQQKPRIFPQLQQNLAEMRLMVDKLSGVNDVHDATLHGLGEHAPAPEDRNLVLVVDDGAEGRAPRGDWRLSTSAYEPAGEGQSEVPAPDVHRSGK